MDRQQLADFMAGLVILAVILMIISESDFSFKESTNVPVNNMTEAQKCPIARIEMTMEKLIQLMGWEHDLEIVTI